MALTALKRKKFRWSGNGWWRKALTLTLEKSSANDWRYALMNHKEE